MKAVDLVTVWGAPDNSRVTAKQYSFRLPVHVAAKLAALEQLYPARSRTQLVGDLLSAAIADVEKTLPSYLGSVKGIHPETGEELCEQYGPRIKYREIAQQVYAQIEQDLGNDTPGDLFKDSDVV